MLMMPMISTQFLPAEEKDYAEALEAALLQLSTTTSEFASAVALTIETKGQASYDMPTERRSIVRQWPLIGARVGALCLYDFFQGTQAINKQLLARCPTVREMVNMEEKKRAQKLFLQSFPHYSNLRNAAAHPAEINSTPEKSAANQVDGSVFSGPHISAVGGVTIRMASSLIGDEYTFTIEGKLISYSVNQGSVEALGAVLNHWRNAFQPVEEEGRRQRFEAFAKLRDQNAGSSAAGGV